MVKKCSLLTALIVILVGCVGTGEKVIYSKGRNTLSGSLCKPQGAGPFPVVVYNHGGGGPIIGGAPEETCTALAEAGFVGFSPIRRLSRSLYGHLDDVNNAVDYVKSLPYVQPSRIGIIGFSRGAMLTYQAAVQRQDLRAIVIMASAVHPSMDLSQAGTISAPVLVLVSENDTGSRRTHGRNTLNATKQLFRALKAADKDATLIIYPPYSDDGHTLFFSVGSYWKDVVKFLSSHV